MKPKILVALLVGILCCPIYAFHLTFHYNSSALSFKTDSTEHGVFENVVWTGAYNEAEDVGNILSLKRDGIDDLTFYYGDEGNILYSFDTDYLGIHNDCPNWEPMGFGDIQAEQKSASKVLRGTQILIDRGDKTYTPTGQELR